MGKGLSVDDAVAELEAAAGDATLAAGLDDGAETKMEFKSTGQLALFDETMLQRQLPSLYAPSRYVLLQLGSGLQIGKGGDGVAGIVIGAVEGGKHVVVEGGLEELLAAGEKQQSASEKLPALIAALDDAARLDLMVRMGKGLSVDDAVTELEGGVVGADGAGAGGGGGVSSAVGSAAAVTSTALRFCVAAFSYDASSADELSVAEGERLVYVGVDPNDNQWVVVERQGDGERGVVPLSYVKVDAESASEGHAALVEMLTADEAQECVMPSALRLSFVCFVFCLFRCPHPLASTRVRADMMSHSLARLSPLLARNCCSHARRYCVALFDFKGAGGAELAITEGEKLRFFGVDPADGAWVKVERLGSAEAGVVPAVYVEVLGAAALKEAVHSGAKLLGAQSKAVVQFDWQDPETPCFVLAEGDEITVVPAQDENYFRGTTASGIGGFVPRAYVELA